MKKITKMMTRVTILLCGLSMSQAVWAYTECTIKIDKIYAGDEGNIHLLFKNGGSTYMTPMDPDLYNILTLSMAAISAQKSITVRYDATGLTCKEIDRTDLRGVYFLSRTVPDEPSRQADGSSPFTFKKSN